MLGGKGKGCRRCSVDIYCSAPNWRQIGGFVPILALLPASETLGRLLSLWVLWGLLCRLGDDEDPYCTGWSEDPMGLMYGKHIMWSLE